MTGWRLLAVALGAGAPSAAVVGHGANGRMGAAVMLVCAAALGAAWASLEAGALRLVCAWLTVAGGAAFFSALHVGRAPVAVTILATSLANLVLVPGRFGTDRRRPSAAAALVVPILIVSQLMWLRRSSVVVTVVGLAAAGLIVAWHHRRPETVERVAARLSVVGRKAGSLAFLGVMALVAVPLLYLPGLVARAISAVTRRATGGTTTWAKAAPRDRQRRDAAMPFEAPAARVAVRRHVTLVIVGLLVAVVAVAQRPDGGGAEDLAASPVEGPPGPTATDQSMDDRLDAVPYSQRPALAGEPYADQLQAETRAVDLVPNDVTGYRLGNISGALVNVEQGRRRTRPPDCPGCPQASVLLVGGSLVFGIGQRDEHTIASELVAAAEADGIALTVHNVGVPGWTAVQEDAAVFELLEGGSVDVDLVVYLDGFNDTVASLVEQLFTGSMGEGPAMLDPTLTERLLATDQPFATFPAAAYGRRAGRRFVTDSGSADRQLGERQIDVARFFQPDASSSEVQQRGVEALGVLPPDFYARSRFDVVLGSSAATAADIAGVVDLRDVLSDLDDPVFMDTSHVNERGARIIARSLYSQLRSRITALDS